MCYLLDCINLPNLDVHLTQVWSFQFNDKRVVCVFLVRQWRNDVFVKIGGKHEIYLSYDDLTRKETITIYV